MFLCQGCYRLPRPTPLPQTHREENFCRFCNVQLPDWKSAFTPSHSQPADPVMVVSLGDMVHRIVVRPGDDGMKEFQERIRALFSIPEEVRFEVSCMEAHWPAQ